MHQRITQTERADLEKPPETDQPNIVSEPKDDQKPIWRYTSISKFLNIIRLGESLSECSHGKLVFVRSDLLDDEYEGTVSKPTIEQFKDWPIELLRSYLDEAEINNLNVPPFEELADFYKEKQANMMREKITARRIKFTDEMKRRTYLNCWRLDEYESSNMWRAYTTPYDGIAIKTTFENFCQSFIEWPDILYIGRIKYTDYEREKTGLDAIGPFFHKRREFTDESEVRAICTKFSKPRSKNRLTDLPPLTANKKTIEIRIDIDTLVEEIVIHPESSDYLKKVL